jgi:hypothetical protein
MPPKLVKYQTVVNQVVFLSPMFDQSNQAKSEEERKIVLEMPRIIIHIPQGLIASFMRLNQLISPPLGEMFGDLLGSFEQYINSF